ncbi:MAG: hypothetical protein R3B48_18170 [Kofleriaceae bacterium]
MTMTRHEFLRGIARMGAAALGASAAASALTACGGGDEPQADAAPGGSCTANGTTVAIATNHGHRLTVSAADITAGVDKTYDITGSALHMHTVTITAAQFATLASNQSITVPSSNSGDHDHTITVNCR